MTEEESWHQYPNLCGHAFAQHVHTQTCVYSTQRWGREKKAGKVRVRSRDSLQSTWPAPLKTAKVVKTKESKTLSETSQRRLRMPQGSVASW